MKDSLSTISKIADKYQVLIVLVLCVVSRLVSTIHYIEDPDSLRFALAVADFDLVKLQPHFPGYPVFCFLLKILTALTGKYSLAFSIIGGIATFIIIQGLLLINKKQQLGISPVTIVLVVFFNPMFWLMGNRYMPDLLGLALVVLAFYYYLNQEHYKNTLIFIFLVGLLAGVRISYLPALIFPVLHTLASRPDKARQIVTGIASVLIWLVPLLLDTGWDNFMTTARIQSTGHFYEWGGAVQTEPLLVDRLLAFIRNIFAEGMGGYWLQRSPVTILVSLGTLFGLFFAVQFIRVRLQKDTLKTGVWIIVFLSLILYALWAFFYQNILYSPRHVMPLLPVLILLVSAGFTYALKIKPLMAKMVYLVFFTGLLIVTLTMAVQHKKPTAIAQAASYIKTRADAKTLILSTELINYYLSCNGIKTGYFSLKKDSVLFNQRFSDYEKVIVVGNFLPRTLGLDKAGFQPVAEHNFYHNPYINRNWSAVLVKEYAVKKDGRDL